MIMKYRFFFSCFPPRSLAMHVFRVYAMMTKASACTFSAVPMARTSLTPRMCCRCQITRGRKYAVPENVQKHGKDSMSLSVCLSVSLSVCLSTCVPVLLPVLEG